MIALFTVSKAARLLRTSNEEDVQEMAASLERFLAGDHRSLDEACGFRAAPGQRSIRTVARIERRNELIRQLAAEHYAASANPAADIATAWRRYASSAWPRERAAISLPVSRFDQPEFVFWKLMKMHDEVLAERTVRSIVATS